MQVYCYTDCNIEAGTYKMPKTKDLKTVHKSSIS